MMFIRHRQTTRQTDRHSFQFTIHEEYEFQRKWILLARNCKPYNWIEL